MVAHDVREVVISDNSRVVCWAYVRSIIRGHRRGRHALLWAFALVIGLWATFRPAIICQMLTRLFLSLSAFVMSGFVGLNAADPKVVWAAECKEWDGWKPDIVKLKEARKVKPLEGCLYSVEVEWAGYHDPGVYSLKSGQEMTLNLNGLKWDEVSEWKPGKKLFLCYDEANGATLLEPVTGRRLTILMMYGKDGGFEHPIDDYLESLNAYTTYDMMSVCYEGTRLLRVEIDRCVKRVLAFKHLPDAQRKNFIRLTKVRLDYCEMQASFGVGAIHANYAGGTAAGPEGLSYRQGLYRRALSDLLSVAEECKAYENPAPPDGK